jgi:ATP-dependent RNA helicase SUPV3L1/SUV3
MLRAENSRAGFEAKPDMLSITGMTLDQFADLMQGLGYAAEKGERPKVKAAAVTPEAAAQPEPASESEAAAVVEAAPDAAADVTAEPTQEAPPAAAPMSESEVKTESEPLETEVFYTFTWGRKPQGAGRPRQRGAEGKPQGKPQGAKGKPKGKPRRDDSAKTHSARPPKADRIDPDNPFAAALMGFKGKT